MPSLQTALDVQAVLEKTAQILQGIDLSLSDQAQAQTSVRAQANAGAAKASTTKVSTTIDTQFDLVASYMDMGELAKAEQLLQQIIQQGDAKQQARAKRLLKKISSE
jgi:FimV-like protein